MVRTIGILGLASITFIGFTQKDKDEKEGNQRAWYETSKVMDIDTSKVDLKHGQIYFQFETSEQPKHLKDDKFTWLKNFPEDYFVSYLVNTTDSTINIKRQDGSIMAIQEAKNESGKWDPIEYWVHSGCGNSYFDPMRLTPNSYAMIPIRKYEGDFKTEMRLKIKNGKQVFYSSTFEGSINKSQFRKETEKQGGILYYGPASYFED